MIHASSIFLALLVASSAFAAPLSARLVDGTLNNALHSALIEGTGPGPEIVGSSFPLIPVLSTGNILTSLPTSTGVVPGSVAPSEPTSTSAFFPLGSPISLPPPKEIFHRDYELDTLTELSARADAEGALRRDLLEARYHPTRSLEVRTPILSSFSDPEVEAEFRSLFSSSLFGPSATATATASTTNDGARSALPISALVGGPVIHPPTPSSSLPGPLQAGELLSRFLEDDGLRFTRRDVLEMLESLSARDMETRSRLIDLDAMIEAHSSNKQVQGRSLVQGSSGLSRRDVLDVLHHYVRDPKIPLTERPIVGVSPVSIGPLPAIFSSLLATPSEATGFGIRPQATSNTVQPNLPVDA